MADDGSHDMANEFFQSHTSVSKVPLNDGTEIIGNAPSKKPSRKRSTSRTKPNKEGANPRAKRASAKSTKAKPVPEKLLSPASALLRMSRQDILFGTSSQLALEEPPTLVRQLQVALKESEVDADLSSTEHMAPPPRWPKLDKAMGKRSLWDASSRDIEGGLLEQMEDVYIPAFDRTQDFPLLMVGTANGPDPAPDSFVDVDDPESVQAVNISSDLPTPPRDISHVLEPSPSKELGVPDQAIQDAVFQDIDDFDFLPPPSNQNAESLDSFLDIDDLLPAPAQIRTSPQPKTKLPASAPLTGSSKKRRGRPLKPESAQSTANVLSTSAAKYKASKAKPKESALAPPPKTPSKGSGRFIDIDEIFDSEDEVMQAFSPTPPRVRTSQPSEPLPLYISSPKPSKPKASSTDPSLTPVHRIPTPHLVWDTLKAHIFSLITAHVRSLTPTTDPARPSWHEKILMYEPIVLEDFTTYLNTHTTIRTYKKATKIQIKAWNKGLKVSGKEELGVLEWEQVVLAVDKDLEAVQVQAWCESMSVCCIWGEGRGKGGVRKGFY
jgi:hypothetical protein